MKAIPGLDGARRQAVAASLWAAWQERGKGAALLTGFSGVGKTEQVVRPLLARARGIGIPAVLIEVPLEPTDLEAEIRGRLAEELRDSGDHAMADAAASAPSLTAAVLTVLKSGALIVVDEFQRVLDGEGRPVEALSAKVRKLAQRTGDTGCVWLVSNREVEATWAEPFHVAHLERPGELADQVGIVLGAIATEHADARFPASRRPEITSRLGGNPRVLRLLGHLLRTYALEELLGPPSDAPATPPDQRLLDGIERSLLAKAKEGLTQPARWLLRDLSILREPADASLLRAMGATYGDLSKLTDGLRERYLVSEHAGRVRVHPTVREVEVPRLRDEAGAWRGANLRAGRWYAAQLSGVSTSRVQASLAGHIAGARYHLSEAGASDALREAMRGVAAYIRARFGWTAVRTIDAAERDAQIAVLGAFLVEPDEPGVEFTYARLLKQRGASGDAAQALPHAQRATLGQDSAPPWVLWIQLVREVEGIEAEIVAAKQALVHVAPSKNLFAVYQLLGGALVEQGRVGDAIDVLLAGVAHAKGNEARLIEAAIYGAAAERMPEALQHVRASAASRSRFGPQVALADVLGHETRGAWRQGAETAQLARESTPTYLHLALQEALCWLGAEEPARAANALARYPHVWKRDARGGSMWLASLVALHNADLPRASELLATYLGSGSAPTTEREIRAALLYEWDHRVRTVGEPNPALTAPILPPSVTGLPGIVRRPQYGGPVLPQHQRGATMASTMIGYVSWQWRPSGTRAMAGSAR